MMRTDLQPSSYQHAIYQWVQEGAGSLIVEAVAGSGKTHTLVEICRRIPRDQSVRFFAFNKGIVETLKGRVTQRNVVISTYHSAGYQAVQQHLGAKIETDKKKMRELIYRRLDSSDRRAYGDGLVQLLGLAKGRGIDAICGGHREVWEGLIDHHDLDFEWLIPPGRMTDQALRAHLEEEKKRVIELARGLLVQSNAAAEMKFEWSIDFDDHLYLPLLWDLDLPKYQWVLVDEAQDTNAVQREMLLRSLAPGGRLIAVGDPYQAIYGWRGAAQDALDLIAKDFSASFLPLSVCYRCASRIVEKAQGVVAQIEAAPDAPEGEVIEGQDLRMLRSLTPQDAILCRNNAPLVETAYTLIKEGVGCQILGRDIGQGLIRLIERLRPEGVEDLDLKLVAWKDRETARYKKLEQDQKARAVEDQFACVQTIIEALEGVRTLGGVKGAIESLFGDGTKPLLTLSTIHKAKGKEWMRVAIVRSDLMPSFWATQAWQQEQERNLLYVGWTRARAALWVMDDAPEWVRKKRRGER